MSASVVPLLPPGQATVEKQQTTEVRESLAQRPLRLAIVGCGAVTEKLHLPALAGSSALQLTALVDPDAERLATLAAGRPPGLHAASSTAGLERYADMALVAAPNHLHAPIAVDLLERGLHVFVEKPLAISPGEANHVIDVAQRLGRKLGVGLIRRHYPSFEFVRCVLDAGWLGRLQSFDLREGVANVWSAASSSLFRRDHGGGVLIDKGSHAFDMLLAWLGPFSSVKCWDDARGGVEANCLVELELSNGVTGVVELSWTRNLRNSCIIRGEKGQIEVGVFPDSAVTLRLQSMMVGGVPTDGRRSDLDIHAADRRQLEAFAHSIRARGEPAVPAAQALESIRLFDACRKNRQALALPWEPFAGDVDWQKFAGKRVLILGGAGFLGSRIVEALAQNSTAHIRVLVRNFRRIAGVARYSLDIVRGDVGDPHVLGQAMLDCDYVINCAYGKGPRAEQVRVNIDAVRTVIRIARERGVRQVVHLSTMMVYGTVTDGVLNEAVASRPRKSEAYAYTKWKGEAAALGDGQRLGVPVVAIQPTAVYGPGAPSWTLLPIDSMKSGRTVLVNGGEGISNAVYVDDAVTAILQAVVEPRAAGERLLVTGPEVVTWRDFYGAYDRLLGGGRTVSMTVEQLAQARRVQSKRRGNLAQLWALFREERQARRRFLALPAVAALRRGVEALLPAGAVKRLKARIASPRPPSSGAPSGGAVRLPSRAQEEFFRAVVAVDSSKAARLIGYKPRHSFASGMALVAKWADWARVLPRTDD